MDTNQKGKKARATNWEPKTPKTNRNEKIACANALFELCDAKCWDWEEEKTFSDTTFPAFSQQPNRRKEKAKAKAVGDLYLGIEVLNTWD